jgi:hypothetical protein
MVNRALERIKTLLFRNITLGSESNRNNVISSPEDLAVVGLNRPLATPLVVLSANSLGSEDGVLFDI